MSMLRKDGPGAYRVGIYEIQRQGRRWIAAAFGPGTIGDGGRTAYPTLAAAYLAITGEPLRWPRS